MADVTKFTGGCHCGAVRFEATTDLARVVECNCSICSKTGTLLVFVPAARFSLLSGEGSLSDYQFAKRRIHHLFCQTCGIRSFARGQDAQGVDVFAVNVRCLEGVDATSLSVTRFDGRSL